MRDCQLSQVTELRIAGTFLLILLQCHQCLGNHTSNTLFGYGYNKTGSPGKRKRLLFIWEKAVIGKGSFEDGRKEGQGIDNKVHRHCELSQGYVMSSPAPMR